MFDDELGDVTIVCPTCGWTKTTPAMKFVDSYRGHCGSDHRRRDLPEPAECLKAVTRGYNDAADAIIAATQTPLPKVTHRHPEGRQGTPPHRNPRRVDDGEEHPVKITYWSQVDGRYKTRSTRTAFKPDAE